MTQTIDAHGAIHNSQGRFAGHVRHETDTSLVLPSIDLSGMDPQITEEEKQLLAELRGHFFVEDGGYTDEPMGPFCEQALSRFAGRRVVAVYNEYRGEGETDPCDPTFVVIDDNGTAYAAPGLDIWLCEDPDDPDVEFPAQLFNPRVVVELSGYEFTSRHLIAESDDSGDEEPCSNCGRLNFDGEGDGETGLCGDCADRCSCSNCGERVADEPDDMPVDHLCNGCRTAQQHGRM